MGYNVNVMNAVNDMASAYGTNKFETAHENYFKVMENEIRNDIKGSISWLGYENPDDALNEAIINGDPVEWVEEILNDYIRFIDMCEKYNLFSRDNELIEKAKKYIKEG